MQPDGGRALAVGKLDTVPEAAGGRALRIVVCDAQIKALPEVLGIKVVIEQHQSRDRAGPGWNAERGQCPTVSRVGGAEKAKNRKPTRATSVLK